MSVILVCFEWDQTKMLAAYVQWKREAHRSALLDDYNEVKSRLIDLFESTARDYASNLRANKDFFVLRDVVAHLAAGFLPRSAVYRDKRILIRSFLLIRPENSGIYAAAGIHESLYSVICAVVAAKGARLFNVSDRRKSSQVHFEVALDKGTETSSRKRARSPPTPLAHGD